MDLNKSASGSNVGVQDGNGDGSQETIVIDLDKYEKETTEKLFTQVTEMFPDVEPTFLRAKCSRFAFNKNGFFEFIEKRMITGNYPKISSQNKTVIALQPDTSGNFNVATFVQKYPDPHTFFNRVFEGASVFEYSNTFLQNRHRNHTVVAIKTILNKTNGNMVLADAKLFKMKSTRKRSLRQEDEINKPDGVPPPEFFAQCQYLENKDAITKYINDKALARQNIVEQARKMSALLTCGCCYSDDLLKEDVHYCTRGHVFCKSCILRYTEVQMGCNSLDFPCLQECGGNFSLKTLKEALPENMFVQVEKMLQERDIAGANIPGLETCTFCSYSAILPEGNKIFSCDNCCREMCILCRRESHIPFRCEEVAEKDAMEKDRLTIEEKLTDALLRTCLKCKRKFIREDGCNKITCVCGAAMCYLCRKPVNGYEHFVDNRSGRPVDNSKCPLWTSNTVLHQDNVLQEGRRAIDELKRKNPDLEKLLPKKKK